MTEKQKLEEIIILLTFLQQYIHNNVSQSFNDLSFDLEILIRDYLNVFEKDDEKFENLNHLKQNYPAIDLLNKSKDIAIQVTTNAKLGKVRKTKTTYDKNELNHNELIVIGFVKATTKKIPNVKVYGIKYLIDLAQFGTSEQKDKIFDLLKNRIPWNSLTPLSDKLCFDVVFDVINRSAVRDYTICEGDFDRMAKGLYEIKEIITTGKVSDKPIRAKALSEYSEKTKIKLIEIEGYISNILQIYYANKNSDNSTFLCLTRIEADEIDNLKEKIIDKSNSLAKELGIVKEIIPSKRY